VEDVRHESRLWNAKIRIEGGGRTTFSWI